MTGRLVIAVALLAGCTSRGTGVQTTAAESGSRDDDPRVVLQRLAEEGEDPRRLAAAVLALRDPEIAFVGEIPITLALADGSLPGYEIHPQGLAWLPETKRWVISAVEITRARDKSEHPKGDPNGEGRPYLFFAEATGRPLPTSTIEPPMKVGSFHPGGIDSAGGTIFFSLSPYARNTRADFFRLPPATTAPVSMGTMDDHIGVVTIGSSGGPAFLQAASWDARRWYTLSLDGRIMWSADTPVPSLGFQDGQGLAGTEYVLWTGNGPTTFGFALIRLIGDTMEPARLIEWPRDLHRTRTGRVPFDNPAFFWADRAQRIWVLAVPEDQHGRWKPRPHEAVDASAVPAVEDPEAGGGTALRLYRVSSSTASQTGSS